MPYDDDVLDLFKEEQVNNQTRSEINSVCEFKAEWRKSFVSAQKENTKERHFGKAPR